MSENVRLGTTDMAITRLGFGAWAIGGGDWAFSWGPQDDEESVRAIRHSIERGINWIDTAAVYGLGQSEEVVAKALAEMPETDRPYVFTKCGLVWEEGDRSSAPQRVGAPASIKREAEASLRRLGVERIDLYQMHWPADDTPIEEYWQAILDLKKEGKIRAAALSNHDVAQLERAEALGHVDCLQPPFSLINRRAAADVLPWCDANDTGVIVYSPMASGLLTGAFSAARVEALDAGDWRKRSGNFNGVELEKNLALADALVPIAEAHHANQASVAIAWTLSFPGVTGAIVGARSPAQVDGWIDASDIELNPSEIAALASAISTTGAGAGPVAPAA
jgi:aryl-alcohol dehydrogenase-like predicted oxidoreductase